MQKLLIWKISMMSAALVVGSVSCAIGPPDTGGSIGRELKRTLDRSPDCLALDQRADTRWTTGNTWSSACDRS